MVSEINSDDTEILGEQEQDIVEGEEDHKATAKQSNEPKTEKRKVN